MKKKVLGILLVGAMVCLLAGCGSATATETAVEAQADGKVLYAIWVNPLVGSAVLTSADNGITAA